MKLLFLIGLTITYSCQSFAVFFQADIEFGDEYLAQGISIVSQKPKPPENFEFSGWSLSGNRSESKVELSSSSQKSTYLTNSLNVGFDFQLTPEIDLELIASGTRTEVTQFEQSNLGGALTYQSNRLTFSYGFTEGQILQDFEFTLLGQLFRREIKLAQYEHTANLGFAPSADYGFQAGYVLYEYSKNKEDLALAFQSRFLNNRAANLIFSIAGLPDSKFNLSANAFFKEDWEAVLNFYQTQLIANDRIIQDTEIRLNYFRDNWIWTLGMVHSYSESRSENSFLLQAGFDWL
jgi:hypothetical protein